MPRDIENKKLIEIDIRFNPEVIAQFFFTRSGLWKHLLGTELAVIWILAGATLQLALPNAFPTIPLLTAPLVTVFFVQRRKPVAAFVAAFAMGIVLDANSFNPIGSSSLILVIVATASIFLNFKLTDHYILGTAIQAAVATAIYAILAILLQRPNSTWSDSFAILIRFLGTTPIVAPILALIAFPLMDLVERLLLGKKSIDQDNEDE